MYFNKINIINLVNESRMSCLVKVGLNFLIFQPLLQICQNMDERVSISHLQIQTHVSMISTLQLWDYRYCHRYSFLIFLKKSSDYQNKETRGIVVLLYSPTFPLHSQFPDFAQQFSMWRSFIFPFFPKVCPWSSQGAEE